MNPIELAKSFETSIEIISKTECDQGIFFLQKTLIDMFADGGDYSLMPILMGGEQVGDALAHANPNQMHDTNPIRMGYYKENKRMEKPECMDEPDLLKIVGSDGKTKDIVFAEAVVDSQGTIKATMAHINQKIDEFNELYETEYSYPEYHTFALVCKIEGDIEIPDLIYAYKVDKNIWVHGRGCDNNDRGREDGRIMGMLALDAEETPKQPYYSKSSIWQ